MGKQSLGEDIKNIVQDAVNTGDFHQLSKDIGKTVDSALDEARKSINWGKDYGKQINRNSDQNSWRNNNSNHNTQNINNAQNAHYNNRNNTNNYNSQVSRRYPTPPKTSSTTIQVGKVSGILCTVFGNIGVGVLGIATIVLMVVGHLIGRDEFFATIVLGILPFLILSVFALARGGKIRKRIRRMQQYIAQIGERNYCLIKDLSISTGLGSRFLIKDLQKMISIGMFPEGHIDDKKTCFMLNNESYKLYLDLQESMKHVQLKEQQKQEEQKKAEEKKQEAVKTNNDVPKETDSIIVEGRQYINQIKKANVAIPGEEVSHKLDRLEDVTGKIFDYVELHPDQLPEIRKFMEYYLPTTLKLLEAYKEFDRQPVQGDNISSAKKEIEKTLDTINLAFENLLDNLFEDAAMDISTDISVLNTMLAQEGLTEKNLKSLTK